MISRPRKSFLDPRRGQNSSHPSKMKITSGPPKRKKQLTSGKKRLTSPKMISRPRKSFLDPPKRKKQPTPLKNDFYTPKITSRPPKREKPFTSGKKRLTSPKMISRPRKSFEEDKTAHSLQKWFLVSENHFWAPSKEKTIHVRKKMISRPRKLFLDPRRGQNSSHPSKWFLGSGPFKAKKRLTPLRKAWHYSRLWSLCSHHQCSTRREVLRLKAKPGLIQDRLTQSKSHLHPSLVAMWSGPINTSPRRSKSLLIDTCNITGM